MVVVCGVDDRRDLMPTNQSLSEHDVLAADGLLKGSGLLPSSPLQFPSSLPAVPRVSNLLPPPPRVGTQNTGIDTRRRVSIDDRPMTRTRESRFMRNNPTASHVVARGRWSPPRHSQRGMHIDRFSSGRDRSPHDRRFSSDRWRYKRPWYQRDRDRRYPPRHHESTRYDDDDDDGGGGGVSRKSEAGSVSESHSDDTSLPAVSQLPSEVKSVTDDKECNDMSTSSTVPQSDSVPQS